MLELAREADWAAVNHLSIQVHDLHVALCPKLYCASDEPLPKAIFDQAIRDRMLYVAKLEGQVVGYVLLSLMLRSGNGIVPHKELCIDAICVDEAFRGQGIGKTMLCDVRALAKAFGCREIRLGVYPQNDGAVAFYQKCGFLIRSIQMQMDV